MDNITRLEDARRARDAAIGGETAERADPLEARVRRYRMRGQELRAIAEEVQLEETRLTLLSLAGSYERMATMLEGLAAEEMD